MKVITGRPPNFDKIIAKFPQANERGVMFCYDGVIYAPYLTHIPKRFHVHENVHVVQQEKHGAEAWWDAYIEDIHFRLEQEIPAHRAEYLHVISGGSRHERRSQLAIIAKKMALPLYGPMITVNQAKWEILNP